MAEIDAALREALRQKPEAKVDLIIHVSGGLSERGAELAARGVEVKRSFGLTNTLSVRCTGRTALELLSVSWIVRIQTDRPVRALER